MGASLQTLLDIYKLFCSSVVEYASHVWSGALSKKNKQDIERVQLNALSIICGVYGKPYDLLLEDLEEETLILRRDKLSLKFAQKCFKNERFYSWFPGTHLFNTEMTIKYFLPQQCLT